MCGNNNKKLRLFDDLRKQPTVYRHRNEGEMEGTFQPGLDSQDLRKWKK